MTRTQVEKMPKPGGKRKARPQKVAVVGLGYVGLPLAVLCARKGHDTVGLDVDKKVVGKIRKGRVPFEDAGLEKGLRALKGGFVATTDDRRLEDRDVVVVCVPTPVTDKKVPQLGPILSAARTISRRLRRGQLIIIESSIYPGAIEEHILPVLESGSHRVGEDFHLAHSPERVDPGNKSYNTENIRRIVGGYTEECTRRAASFLALKSKPERIPPLAAA